MRTFGAVFVLFRPTADSLAHLEGVRADCPWTVVVDNTPDPDTQLHERLRAGGVRVIANRNNGGLAGAYNRGVEYLVDHDVELCFLLDQDSEIEPGFFTRMAAAAEPVRADALLLGPRVYEIEMDKYLPAELDGAQVAPGVWSVPFVISSGSAVSAAAYAELGPFREELFIEYVDVDYSLRATAAGIAVLLVEDEVLRQHTGAITKHGPFFTTNHVAWRRYYLVRNSAWLVRHQIRSRGWRLAVLRQIARELFVALAFEKQKVGKSLAILCGAADALRDRLGTFEQLHPAVHRRVTR